MSDPASTVAEYRIRLTTAEDAEAVSELQPSAFPPPFDPDYHWQPRNIAAHVRRFPEGQFVAELVQGPERGRIVASSSNAPISEDAWEAHRDEGEEPYRIEFGGLTGDETTLYGADIAVHPDFRKRGIARAIYAARFDLVRNHPFVRYGTATRMPDYARGGGGLSPDEYARAVVEGRLTDRTLTPLLKMGLTFLRTIPATWPDEESGGRSTIMEWRP